MERLRRDDRNGASGKDFARSFSYLSGGAVNRKSNQIGEAKYTFDGSVKLGYTYQYDAMDRITEVRKSGSPNSQYLEYEYDALGQLVSATDYAAGLEYTYTFDTAGNVLSAVKHPTSGGSASTRTYHYDNASWRDLLTSITIDGTTKEISYPHDIRGNITAGTPLSWGRAATGYSIKAEMESFPSLLSCNRGYRAARQQLFL